MTSLVDDASSNTIGRGGPPPPLPPPPPLQGPGGRKGKPAQCDLAGDRPGALEKMSVSVYGGGGQSAGGRSGGGVILKVVRKINHWTVKGMERI